MRFRNLALLCLGAAMTVGFRVYPKEWMWSVVVSDPTLWVQSCQEPSINSSDLPPGDPLSGTTPTYAEILQSIIDDYNDVSTSFIRLALYPVDPASPGSPLPGDSQFTVALAEKRTIHICVGQQVTTGGHAQYYVDENGRARDCKVQLNSSSLGSAAGLVRTLTHEIGHCLGLKHVQQSTKAVMSYYANANRLQDDDKMAVTYLYPQNEKDGEELVTLGLSCSTR